MTVAHLQAVFPSYCSESHPTDELFAIVLPGEGRLDIVSALAWFVLDVEVELLEEYHPPSETSPHIFKAFQWVVVGNQLEFKTIQVRVEFLDGNNSG